MAPIAPKATTTKPAPEVKGVVSDKKVRQKKAPVKKAPRRTTQRVEIALPTMSAPFGGPRKYDEGQNTATLTVNFRDEENRPELRALRTTLTKVTKTINKLLRVVEASPQLDDLVCPRHNNTFIREGAPRPTQPTERYPDMIKLKMYPTDIKFVGPEGVAIDMTPEAFADYDVQPTVELRDVWKVGGKFYPRLVITRCVVHPRRLPPPIVLPSVGDDTSDEEDEDDTFTFLPTPPVMVMTDTSPNLDPAGFEREFQTTMDHWKMGLQG